MISDERLQKALTYLAETDEDVAELKADVARAEYLCKRSRAAEFLAQTAGTVKEREARAETSDGVEQAENRYTAALVAHEKMAAKRKTEVLIVETWRSINANRRQGT